LRYEMAEMRIRKKLLAFSSYGFSKTDMAVRPNSWVVRQRATHSPGLIANG
jgi:hypothetical protein